MVLIPVDTKQISNRYIKFPNIFHSVDTTTNSINTTILPEIKKRSLKTKKKETF